MRKLDQGEKGILLIFGAIFVSIAGWITHVINCLLTAKYVLLVAGGIVFPIGIIHGIGLWFGINW